MAGVYAIVDLPYPYDVAPIEIAQALCRAGVSHLQLRAKRFTTAQRVDVLRTMAPLCAANDVPLWVNDDVDAALLGLQGVAGVHLGQEDLSSLHAQSLDQLRAANLGLGLSTHSLAQIDQAQKWQPAYLGFGPIFPTLSKQNPEAAVGLAALATAVKQAHVPIVAIGGIDARTLAAVRSCAVSSVAMISALCGASSAQIEAKTRDLVQRFEQG